VLSNILIYFCTSAGRRLFINLLKPTGYVLHQLV